jgi:hypothetical protein
MEIGSTATIPVSFGQRFGCSEWSREMAETVGVTDSMSQIPLDSSRNINGLTFHVARMLRPQTPQPRPATARSATDGYGNFASSAPHPGIVLCVKLLFPRECSVN